MVGTSAQDDNDRVIYDQAAGNLYFDSGGNGAQAAILIATLTPGTEMSWVDILSF